MNHRVAVIALDEKSSRPITVMSVVLADPRTGTGQGYMLLNGRLLECQHFKQMFSAWLVGSQLLPDGGLHTCTPMDPLFVLLPVLDTARKQVPVEATRRMLRRAVPVQPPAWLWGWLGLGSLALLSLGALAAHGWLGSAGPWL
ncbi:hypothetical protein QJQ45_015963 [Haematococcus lacustris]|nr:hypothetical protein QJQ45_015963 [Haematococcus lacustris]